MPSSATAAPRWLPKSLVNDMTEKEKMLAGHLYLARDPELEAAHARAEDLCFRFNQTPPSRSGEGKALLRELFGKTGEVFTVNPFFWCDYGSNITLGERFYSNHNLVILDVAPVVFGDHVMLGPNCGFYTAGHPIDVERRSALLEYGKPITVGSGVWFGGNVVVMPGVTIGSNVVIGGGSVVTRDIPDGVVAAGNPCRVIRPVTDEDKKTQY